MRRRFRQRNAVAGELSQCYHRKVPAHYPYATCGPKADAAHARCRSAPGTAKPKESHHSVRKIVASHCRQIGKTRANNSVFEPARVLNVAVVQQLWLSAKLSDFPCCAYV